MAIVNAVSSVKKWLEDNVCPLVELKVPDKTRQNERYDYSLAHPVVFSYFAPVSNAETRSNPSILIQFLKGTDNLEIQERTFQFRLVLSVWNNGENNPDLFIPAENEGEFRRKSESSFDLSGDSWMDLWNFGDVVLRELESASEIGSLRLVREQSPVFYPVADQDSALEFGSYYFGVIEFAAVERFVRSNGSKAEKLTDLL